MRDVTYAAAGAVVMDGPLVLLLHRPSRGEMRLPKGHVETGEDPLQAALRETREESGYRDLRPLGDLGEMTVSFDLDGRRIIRVERYFLMDLESRVVVARPAKDARQFRVRWRSAEQALRELTFETEREWVRRALREMEPRTAGRVKT